MAFIDDDAVAEPGWAAALLNAFEIFPQAAAIGGPVRPLWQSPRPAWLGDDMLGHLSIIDHGKGPRMLPPGQHLVGCNMAFRRTALDEAGGFPRQLGRIGSELSLLSNGDRGVFERLRGAIGYTPDAVVHHRIDAARLTQSWFRRRAAWQAVSDYLMNPQAAAAHAPAAARHLRLVETSGARGRAVGFFGDVTGTAEFEAEMLLIRELTIATIHGGAEILARPSMPLAAGIVAEAKLRLRAAIRKRKVATAAIRAVRQAIGIRP